MLDHFFFRSWFTNSRRGSPWAFFLRSKRSCRSQTRTLTDSPVWSRTKSASTEIAFSNDRPMKISTGALARFADGSATVRIGTVEAVILPSPHFVSYVCLLVSPWLWYFATDICKLMTNWDPQNPGKLCWQRRNPRWFGNTEAFLSPCSHHHVSTGDPANLACQTVCWIFKHQSIFKFFQRDGWTLLRSKCPVCVL